jgi:hypothetical protein
MTIWNTLWSFAWFCILQFGIFCGRLFLPFWCIAWRKKPGSPGTRAQWREMRVAEEQQFKKSDSQSASTSLKTWTFLARQLCRDTFRFFDCGFLYNPLIFMQLSCVIPKWTGILPNNLYSTLTVQKLIHNWVLWVIHNGGIYV